MAGGESSAEAGAEELGTGTGNIAASVGSGPAGSEEGVVLGQRGPAPFLLKTYGIVDDPANDDVISWSAAGTSFIIWKPDEFSAEVLPTAFKHSNQSSFVRQLNIYGFKKVTTQRLEFAHYLFVRGDKSRLHLISRSGQGGQTEAVYQVRTENQWLKQQLQQCMALYELVVQQVEAWGIPRATLSQRLGVHLPHSDPKLPIQLLLGKPITSEGSPFAEGQLPRAPRAGAAPAPPAPPATAKQAPVELLEASAPAGSPASSTIALLSRLLARQQQQQQHPSSGSQSMLGGLGSPFLLDMATAPELMAGAQAEAAEAGQAQLLHALLAQAQAREAAARSQQEATIAAALQAAGLGLDLGLQPPATRSPPGVAREGQEAGWKRGREGAEPDARRTSTRALQPSQGSAFSKPVATRARAGSGEPGLPEVLAQRLGLLGSAPNQAPPADNLRKTVAAAQGEAPLGRDTLALLLGQQQQQRHAAVRGAAAGQRGGAGGAGEAEGADRKKRKLFGMQLGK